ncbi:MAG: hypothetical protein RR576_05220 [Oscillospiraceae bacterium]
MTKAKHVSRVITLALSMMMVVAMSVPALAAPTANPGAAHGDVITERQSITSSHMNLQKTGSCAKHLIDELHTKHPAWGLRQLSKQMKAAKLPIGRLKTRRYMDEMGI